MLDQFPKKRTILPDAFREIYKKQYKSNREGDSKASSMSQKLESWLHKKVAKDLTDQTDLATLEIGAGTLNHLKYEATRPYDIIEPFHELFSGSPELINIRKVYADISEIPKNTYYDRIISIATFEHILNLPEVVAKTCLMLNENGSLRISIPNEGYFLWTLGWRCTTGLEFYMKYKMNYGILMKHEHVNTADEIEKILRHFYGSVKGSYFGVGKWFALYRFYECQDPKINEANLYLDNYSPE